MIGINMKPNILVHYQKGEHIQKYRRVTPPLPTYNPSRCPPTPNIQPLPCPPPPPIFYFYSICTKQESFIPL